MSKTITFTDQEIDIIKGVVYLDKLKAEQMERRFATKIAKVNIFSDHAKLCQGIIDKLKE